MKKRLIRGKNCRSSGKFCRLSGGPLFFGGIAMRSYRAPRRRSASTDQAEVLVRGATGSSFGARY
ncbi:MAG TPA: hypothetical protein VIM38_11390, partial [Alphaproteobacteria bacterium]